MRLARALPIAILTFLVAPGCSGKNPITGSGTVVYRVSGSATRADVTYSTSGGGTEQQANVALPWSVSISAHDDDFLYIAAQNDGETGCVSVEIRSGDDTLNSAQSCGAFVIASTNATF